MALFPVVQALFRFVWIRCPSGYDNVSVRDNIFVIRTCHYSGHRPSHVTAIEGMRATLEIAE
jgi:hypothetical protein